MSTVYRDKLCKGCKIEMKGVDASRLFCDSCRIDNLKVSRTKYVDSHPKYKRPISCYEANFKKVVNSVCHLTPTGFDEVSEISASSYLNYYKKSWCEVIEGFGKLEELYEYIKSEFILHCRTNTNSIRTFVRSHKYLTENITTWFGHENIACDCGIKYNKRVLTNADLVENFNYIKSIVGNTPLFNEFKKYTRIDIKVYSNRLNLKEKVYSIIVKKMVSEDEYLDFRKRQKAVRKENMEILNLHNDKYTLKELEDEFKRVFDECYKNHRTYPSRKYFNKMSKYDESVYRHRLNINWTLICRHYGYDEISRNKIFETIVLSDISTILNEKCEPQKTWEWLRGVKGYKLICDGFFPKHKLVVETDGKQHKVPMRKFGGYKGFSYIQESDRIKDVEIQKNGYMLLRIDIDTDWHDKEYLKSRLIESGILQP